MNTLDKILENMGIVNFDVFETNTQVATAAMEIATAINGGLVERVKEDTGGKPTAFISFSGHVATLKIKIETKGWSRTEKEEATKEFVFNDMKPLEENKEVLKELVKLAIKLETNNEEVEKEVAESE